MKYAARGYNRENSMTLLCKIILFKVIVIHQLFWCVQSVSLCVTSLFPIPSTALLHSSSFLPPFLFFSISQNISFIFSISFLICPAYIALLSLSLSTPSVYLFFFFLLCLNALPICNESFYRNTQPCYSRTCAVLEFTIHP